MKKSNQFVRLASAGGVALMIGAFASPAAMASALNGLVAHRAVYEVKLLESTDRSGIRAMNGRIVYEFVGSPCEGFAVKFRFVTRIDTGRKSYVTDQRTTTFEDIKDGNLRFVTRSYVNDKFEREVSGSAKLTDAGMDVALAKPKNRKLQLGKAIFMTEHLASVIEKAKSGEKIFLADVFDGSDNGDELMATTTVIGNKSTDTKPDLPEKLKMLKDKPSWPVSISYFSLENEQKGESLPIYRVSFDLFENGISSDLQMHYKDYSLKGKLSGLELLPVSECK
jgi:hypothetical protein